MPMGVKRDRASAGMSENNATLTEDEAALYDRQIRLWGLDCQRRLRDAKVLMIGLNGLGVEVVKNLTLCGVQSITLMDETPVSESDYSAQFFAVGHLGEGRASASKPSIQELNPRVLVHVNHDSPAAQPASFFAGFSAVFATGLPLKGLLEVSRLCREAKVRFFCGDTFGMHGWGFLDLLKHKFANVQISVDGQKNTNFETWDYCSLETALAAKFGAGIGKFVNKVYLLMHMMSDFHEQHGRFPSPGTRDRDVELLKETQAATLRKLNVDGYTVKQDELGCVFGELSPVCAAVGGIISDQIVKGISCSGLPIRNFLLFDGDSCIGATQKIPQ